MRALLLFALLLPARFAFACNESAVVLHQAAERAFGDLEQMRQRGTLRILVAPSRTNFFISRGELHGFSCDLLNEFGRDLQRQHRLERRELTVVFIPLTYDELIPALLDGRGDLAAAITVAPGLENRVAFSEPYFSDVAEIIVASKAAPEIRSIDELADRRVVVPRGLTSRLPFKVIQAPEALATEDLLEMVNAGLIEFTIARRPIADAWAQVLPNVVVRADLAAYRGDQIALAVRRESAELLAHVNEFLRTHHKGTGAGNELFRRYFENSRWFENPLSDDPLKNLRGVESSFRKYAAAYQFDWLFLAAQGFQESQLRQDARSSVGAEGIMQLRPGTARQMGFDSIATADENIHAGAKYMAWLRDTFFNAPQLAPAARSHFTLAAYNAGPGNVKRWREITRSRGRDPDKWLDSVELISLEEVGERMYRYVRNIDKYYFAYTDWSRELSKRAADVKTLERDGTAR